MGIVNRTPDSFFDGGRMELDASVDFALGLVEEGADVLDLGGVRAGPGAEVSEDEEAERLLPLVEAIAARTDTPLSVETGRAAIAHRAVELGARYLNDVTGLADPELADACSASGATLVLMHHGGQIRGRPLNPRYDDVVASVRDEWERLASIARGHGVSDERMVVDPGLDFGKNTFHSLELMRRIDEVVDVPWPVLIAASRKDVVGETLGAPPDQRLEGSLTLAALAARAGAAIVRVHDVAATVRVVRMADAVAGTRPPIAPVRGLWE